jgi:4-aminobutyrate aminotransferase / (S)-3-amino-2-methylpropionate transaminase / 5-aminovalerate transaminase
MASMAASLCGKLANPSHASFISHECKTMALIQHPGENQSNAVRQATAHCEAATQRTFTPTQAVIAKSAGVFHWTLEGRKLFDFTSGVLVANLGHHPAAWLRRFQHYLGWDATRDEDGYSPALPLTAYNAITPLETDASKRLVDLLRSCPGGSRLQQVLWAASGSEAIQKALWAALNRDPARPMILATRHGFHGKKGLAGAVTGQESDPERDARVRFISFPMETAEDVPPRERPFDPLPCRQELETLWKEHGRKLGSLITEPYLGGGGSHHPPVAYLQLLQDFCREHDLLFILDEVQSNFGRTGRMFAFEAYGLEPDFVVLGKGLGNGIPVAATVGRRDVLERMGYGLGSDTYSANPLSCAAVLATLDSFALPCPAPTGRETHSVLEHVRAVSPLVEKGLRQLRQLAFVKQVRGEPGGMVWGIEFSSHQGRSPNEMANAAVLAAYQGDGSALATGIHLLGPLAGKVVRVAPPLVISSQQARESGELLLTVLRRLNRPPGVIL